MQCQKCKSEMIKVDTINEWFCPNCTHCPRCNKAGTVIDKFNGVMNCKKCSEEMKFKPMSGFFMNEERREYFATPFYKIMGLKPKPEEIKMEKEMHRRGLTFLDMKKIRNMNARFDSSKIRQQLENGDLHESTDPSYHRQ